MGADQSSPGKAPKGDSLSTCDTNKPIDSSGSPSLITRARNARAKGSLRDKPHDIVVVSEGTSNKQKQDEELEKLSKVPTFLPLLKSSLPSSRLTLDQEHIEKLNSQELLSLCSRYQEHLQQCAEAVTFDQNALCVRIKEVDAMIANIYGVLSERQKRYAKYAEHIQKVNEIQTTLNKVKFSLQQTMPLMEYLNGVLPAEERLEPFQIDEILPKS